MDSTALEGRTALVTGVSRRLGIGFAIADRLRHLGASVYSSGWSAHDAEMLWGADDAGALGFDLDERDLEDPDAPAALIDVGIVANCINPGPVDTGYLSGAEHASIANQFPGGQWGTPGNVADLVAFLVSDRGAWTQGQVINSEGGFRRGG